MKASVFLISFLSLFLLAFPIQAQNGDVTIPSPDSSVTIAPSTGTTAGSTTPVTPSPWSFTDIEALSLLTHNFTTGETNSGATFGAGIAAHYAAAIPLGVALVLNYKVSTDSTNMFGFSILGQAQHFVIGPTILFLGRSAQYCLSFGGSTSIY
jgi:hypothetical protein